MLETGKTIWAWARKYLIPLQIATPDPTNTESPAPVQKQTPIVSRRNVKVSKKKTLYMLCYTVKPMMVWVVSYWSALEIFNLVYKLKLLLGLTYKLMKMWSYP